MTKIQVALFLFALTLFYSSCRKEPELATLTIKGIVADPNVGAIGNASVQLSVQEIVGGVWSTTFTSIASTTTSSSGAFEFNFDNRSAVEYRVEVLKDNHFGVQSMINPQSLSPETPLNVNIDMYSQAWLRVNIKNTSPVNSDDQLLYTQTGGVNNCSQCCTNVEREFNGELVDTSFICPLYGNQTAHYTLIETKNMVSSSTLDSIFLYAAGHYGLND